MYFELDMLVYVLFIAAMIFSIYAQVRVSSTYRKYSNIPCGRGESAATVARRMLNSAGIYDVRIERVPGNLTDHYDPRTNVLRLSDAVFDNSSAAAIGVAAHEAGHAVQYAENYFPVKLRRALVPITNFASRASWILIMLGVLITAFSATVSFGYYVLLFGIGLFGVTTLFQLVTLPCEFNASARAIRYLDGSGVYSQEDVGAAKKVLWAAAMTYVAALAVSALQLLRLLLIVAGNRRRR